MNGNNIGELQRRLSDPKDYFVAPDLQIAIDVALMLGQPLLVTGEPGTGKTQLAKRVAYERNLPAQLFPLVFNTKSISTAKDLFYQYDALAHFHHSQINKSDRTSAEPYITYEALGQAVLLTLPPDHPQRQRVQQYLPKELVNLDPVRPVVLIDEIDKAPRDLPNDVLNEIENMTFTVREIVGDDNKPGLTFTADPQFKPIVIITSNSEKDLPDAFLRRCVFYHISFPKPAVLNKIVEDRLNLQGLSKMDQAKFVNLFVKIRGLNLKKPPATAELLYWMRTVENRKINLQNLAGDYQPLFETYFALAKNPEDLQAIRDATERLVAEVLEEADG